ncbi:MULTISPECIES: hypothetical protein [Convivina]|uniref:Uncharacterized protein n=2 Tax=Convivina TaxID=1697027 RepID=A0A2U1DFN9_9LACO|nr:MULTISPECIES: hypothetical protein [Convivina]SDC12719.1 hypothetical protein SAMN05216341_1148 [Leuconostocaceae bacterium R-53105]PVY86503.1 hypothetical protein C7384_101423 [Convivina intestini]CAH1853343.1 hypothetical protein R077815_00805 [Convivina sp. LMG 32447]CAH1854712.1 hypothetical protein LMG032447_00919 [Convivina sp. LMG 32447]CAH1857593.1 hypothetical protein R077811_01619 [Convivina intestini]
MKKVGNGFDQEFRNTLNDNFDELSATKNINGKQFNTLGDRLNAIELALQSSGLPIDGDPDTQ